MKKDSYNKWGIKTKSTPFGTQEPSVRPFGEKEIPQGRDPIFQSHRKTSSPLASPTRRGVNALVEKTKK